MRSSSCARWAARSTAHAWAPLTQRTYAPQGIFAVRSERYAGHLRDEKELFLLLIRLYRSPDMLVRVTGEE